LNWHGEEQVCSYDFFFRSCSTNQLSAEGDVRVALAAVQKPLTPDAQDADKTTITETTEHEMTYAANTTVATTVSAASGKSGTKTVKKKGGKPKLTAKEKKERNVRVCLLLVRIWSDKILYMAYRYWWRRPSRVYHWNFGVAIL
jgi:DASH complex subunit DAM1